MSVKGRKKEEKCCGNCCWFYAEDTDGWGQCILQDYDLNSMHCSDMCEDDYVSRQEMRHHMAVLLQASRYYEQGAQKRHLVGANEFKSAIKFAYKYMKAFSKL